MTAVSGDSLDLRLWKVQWRSNLVTHWFNICERENYVDAEQVAAETFESHKGQVRIVEQRVIEGSVRSAVG